MSLNIKYEHRQNDIYTWSDETKGALEYRTPHLHRELELVFYLGGRTAVQVGSVHYELEAGDIFLTFPNQIHSYETLEKERFRLFLVKPELMPELMQVFHMAVPTSAVVKGRAEEPELRMLWQSLARVCVSPPDAPYRKQKLHGYLLALFSEVLCSMSLTGLPTEDSDALRAIVSFCSRNYDKDLSLTVLEENLHLNKYYISHLLSGKLGLRFNDYINSLRISEACRCLLNTDESITDISNHVGFNTLRTFNRAFVKQLGMSPSQYRKSSEGKSLPAPMPAPAAEPAPCQESSGEAWEDCGAFSCGEFGCGCE